jgi:hypothetical protein
MNNLSSVKIPELHTVRLSLRDPTRLELTGTITSPDPSRDLQPFLRSVHDAATADRMRSLEVDVSGLSFVNSAAIRLFIDWICWLRSESEPSYTLKVLTSSRVAWQTTSLAALTSLAGDLLEIRQVD